MAKISNVVFWGFVLACFAFICLTQTWHETYAQEVGISDSDSSTYQISAFSHAGSPSGAAAMIGAYIIDTKSGKVWLTINNGQPNEIGSIKK